MAMRATTRETALTGFRFMSLGRGHIFGTGVDSRSCEPFGGMFMILFCRKLFSVKFNLLAGERSAGHMPGSLADAEMSRNCRSTCRRNRAGS